jgi:hypothetical protein
MFRDRLDLYLTKRLMNKPQLTRWYWKAMYAFARLTRRIFPGPDKEGNGKI